jgi:hypothetical protein
VIVVVVVVVVVEEASAIEELDFVFFAGAGLNAFFIAERVSGCFLFLPCVDFDLLTGVSGSPGWLALLLLVVVVVVVVEVEPFRGACFFDNCPVVAFFSPSTFS